MQLQDLLTKPLSELTDDEVDQRLLILKKLKLTSESKPRTKKSNTDRQVDDLLSKLSDEDKKKLMELLK